MFRKENPECVRSSFATFKNKSLEGGSFAERIAAAAASFWVRGSDSHWNWHPDRKRGWSMSAKGRKGNNKEVFYIRTGWLQAN